MVKEKSFETGGEKQEKQDFKLTIVVHRHGEKASLAGGLSERGKEETANYFSNAYQGVPLDLPEGQGVDVEHSPIDRTEQTALLSAHYSGPKVDSIHIDERLSEGKVAHHKELMDAWGGLGGRWIPNWMNLKERPASDVKTAEEVVKDFSQWLLEKITARRQIGGTQEIDAFSHYPVMIAFLIKLEEQFSIKLLPEGWQKEKDSSKLVNFLESFNFFIDSKNSKVVSFSFRGQKLEIPLSAIEHLAGAR